MTNPPSKAECDAALDGLEVDAHVSWDKLRANNNADQVRAYIAHLEAKVKELDADCKHLAKLPEATDD